MIISSANISITSYNRLLFFMNKLSIKRSLILKSVLEYAVKNKFREADKVILYSRIKNQRKKRSKTEWKIINLNIPSELYESCLDCRKLFKVSVSSILEAGIDLYLDLIMEDFLDRKSQRYHINNYLQLYSLKQKKARITGFFSYKITIKYKISKNERSLR